MNQQGGHDRMIKKKIPILGGLGVALLLAAAAAGAATQQSDRLRDKLAVWTGHWKIRIYTRETHYTHARTDNFDAKCSFLPHGAFVFCDYLALQPDAETGRVVDDISLIYYSRIDKTFKYTNVAPEGGPHENIMRVDGNTWTRPFDIPGKKGGVIEARNIYEFVSPGKHLARFEISTDKGAHWILINEAVGVKVGA
jgi:hypothetical protein